MNITEPFFDGDEIRQIQEVLASKWVTQGPKTTEFEDMFAKRHKLAYALATTSCTSALHLAALALGLKEGDEVIVPAFTWVTSAYSVEYVGATPIFADIDLATYNIDPKSIVENISSKTRAIIAVHLFGRAAPMAEIMRIAKEHDLLVIEDAACAAGTTYNNIPVGAIGDVGCFSFHPRKVITTGEGGMVTTNRAEIAERVKSLRNHGSTGPAFGSDPSKPYSMSTFDILGYNLRMSDIHAAVGIAQIRKLDFLLRERRKIGLRYTALLSETNNIICPLDDPGHTYQSYVIRIAGNAQKKRNRMMEHLADLRIQTRPGTHAVPRLGYYKTNNHQPNGRYPNAICAEDTSITLPIFPGMTIEQQDYVLEGLLTALNR